MDTLKRERTILKEAERLLNDDLSGKSEIDAAESFRVLALTQSGLHRAHTRPRSVRVCENACECPVALA